MRTRTLFFAIGAATLLVAIISVINLAIISRVKDKPPELIDNGKIKEVMLQDKIQDMENELNKLKRLLDDVDKNKGKDQHEAHEQEEKHHHHDDLDKSEEQRRAEEQQRRMAEEAQLEAALRQKEMEDKHEEETIKLNSARMDHVVEEREKLIENRRFDQLPQNRILKEIVVEIVMAISVQSD